MNIQAKINGAYIIQILKNSLRIRSELGQRISTAEFSFLGEEIGSEDKYGFTEFPAEFPIDLEWHWIGSGPCLSISSALAIGGYILPYELDECTIDRMQDKYYNCAITSAMGWGGKSTWLDHFFGGYIVSIERTKLGPSGGNAIYHCQAQDYNILPAKTLITENYLAQTEAQIITDLFGIYLPDIDVTTYVESSGTTYDISWERALLNDALDELAKICNREWYIDYEKKLHYFTPSIGEAPFQLSDIPERYSTISINYKDIRHVQDVIDITNKVTVIGDTSIPIEVTRQDNDSYDRYGRWFDGKIVDSNIDTVDRAEKVGDALLAEKAFGKVIGSLTCYQEGLVKGQKVRIVNDFRNIDDYFLIRSVQFSMLAPEQERIEVEYGDYKPKLIDLLSEIGKAQRKEQA